MFKLSASCPNSYRQLKSPLINRLINAFAIARFLVCLFCSKIWGFGKFRMTTTNADHVAQRSFSAFRSQSALPVTYAVILTFDPSDLE